MSWPITLQEVVADRARGSYVYTSDGKRHLDFACGIGTLSTGHCHPHVVKAIQEQVELAGRVGCAAAHAVS